MVRGHDESRLTEPDPSLFSSCGYACMRTLFPLPHAYILSFSGGPTGRAKRLTCVGKALFFSSGAPASVISGRFQKGPKT